MLLEVQQQQGRHHAEGHEVGGGKLVKSYRNETPRGGAGQVLSVSEMETAAEATHIFRQNSGI